MVDLVHLQHDWLNHVMADELEVGEADEVGYILPAAREKVVQADDLWTKAHSVPTSAAAPASLAVPMGAEGLDETLTRPGTQASTHVVATLHQEVTQVAAHKASTACNEDTLALHAWLGLHQGLLLVVVPVGCASHFGRAVHLHVCRQMSQSHVPAHYAW